MKELVPQTFRGLPQGGNSTPEYSYRQQNDEVHLRDYWKMLVKRRRIVLTIFLAFSIFGAYFPLKATKLYTASATIKIEPQNPQVTGVGTLQSFEGLLIEYDYYRTQFALLKSRRVAATVINDLGLESNQSFTTSIVSPNPLDHVTSWLFRATAYLSGLARSFWPDSNTGKSETGEPFSNLVTSQTELNVPPSLIARYQGLLEVAPIPKTRLVQVKFATSNPALSQALANAHVQSFLKLSVEHRVDLTKDAQEFLHQKKSELQEKLGKAESALNNFRRLHGVVSVEKGENIVVDRLIDLNRQLTAARAQRLEAESLYRVVENKNHQDLADIMRQGLVQQLKSNVATLEAEQARLSTTFRPNHPRIQELAQQIILARQALDSEIANVVRGIRSSYAAAVAKEQALDGEAKKQQQDALKLKEVGVGYAALQEEVNANRALYENVIKRLSETNVSNDLAASNMEIAEMAAKPLTASGPKTSLFLLGSMISGLFFGVGLACILEYFDSIVRTPTDVRRSVGLGTLGTVPDLKSLNYLGHKHKRIAHVSHHNEADSHRIPAKELIISQGPMSLMNESYRAIRTSLLLCQAERPPQIVLLTSPLPGEGKTVTTLNLAIALAADDYSVLVIDGDMRKGCCHNRLGLRNSRGLSNVLSGSLSLEEAIQPTSVNGLSFLSRGVLAPNPTELLGSRKMKLILHELRQMFTFILIDSPPLIAASDAAVLSVLSDGVILVFHGQKTSTASAQEAVERLDMVHAQCLGVVLNGVNLDDPHYAAYRTYAPYYGSQESPSSHVKNENGKHFVESAFFFNRWNINRKHEDNSRYSELHESVHLPVINETARGGDEKKRESAAADLVDDGTVAIGPMYVADGRISDADTQSILSPQCLNRLIDGATRTIGPIAPLIVREKIAELGESESAFPKGRLGELVTLIIREFAHNQTLRSEISAAIGDVDR